MGVKSAPAQLFFETAGAKAWTTTPDGLAQSGRADALATHLQKMLPRFFCSIV